ncbi:acyltransferase family protein [Dyella sedimenti]|uniref:acyltransferase family protein n=1 Tax=Dyella sedimenti TaxID=2919947 RepID=UPI001FA95F67
MFRTRTLADALDARQDNFLLLRFLAASLVIYGHGPSISGGLAWPDLFAWLGWGTYSGDIAVDVFFVTSGYMIAGSYLRRRHLPDFLWARVLRIYPAYLACLLACALALGPLFTSLPPKAYLADPGVFHYVNKNLELGKGLAWHLPGVFATNPLAGIVNGSIWTLPAEIRMYLWVAVLGALGILARPRWCNAVLALLFAWGLAAPGRLPLVPLDTFVRLAGYFAAGVFCFVNRSWLRFGWAWVAVGGALAWALRHTALYPFAFGLALTAFVFAFAYATPWRGFNRLGDYSYGLYLWGFPVQQAVAAHATGWALACNALLAWPLALLLAVVSWHAIEKPALMLKDVPRRLYLRLRTSNT